MSLLSMAMDNNDMSLVEASSTYADCLDVANAIGAHDTCP